MNIRDVAALAGVSPATVSRLLNQTGRVSAVARERIEKVIQTTDYDPGRKSGRIEVNHNPTIGVVIPSLLNPVFSEIVSGIQARARHFGFSVMIADTGYERERERQAVVDLIRQRVAGVILTVASVENNEALSLLREFRFPFCLVHNRSEGNEPSVFVDNYQAGHDVASQLIASGHTRLGMVAGQFQVSDRARQRYAGFLSRIDADDSALSEALIEVDPCDDAPFDHSCLLTMHRQVTAWFCSNDLLAMKLMHYFSRRGIRVPEAVSVVGFDGMSFGQLVSPPLATVRVPHRTMGNCAVDLLFNSRHQTGLTLQRQLDYEMSLRGSVMKRQSPLYCS
ncbi:HTH-type transcriptional repressor CytR [Vibrio aerogenes CECT 7868]|uniref:HTH-type transcriptional repressor CytR n=1 Tax=Vibrio aerogenes CECT 7868 TaxID=1216006 RepID=A0A1M5ZMZ6_9VIBR|nr:substrate-binding domain-containing protein [Vibrio aerogenes]SHI25667.1 HTH-type transcriptional repressor CytR [Vibrio aerogenes CECT 7868]